MWILGLVVFGAVLGLMCLVAIPIVLATVVVGVALYGLLQIVLLPLRLFGWALAIGAGAIGLFLKLFVLLLAGFIGIILMLVLAAPLLPFVLIGLGVWLAARARRHQMAPRAPVI
jgi:hypothetical protein